MLKVNKDVANNVILSGTFLMEDERWQDYAIGDGRANDCIFMTEE